MNLLITGALHCEKNLLTNIQQLGYTVLFQADERYDLNVETDNIDVVICNSLFLYHNIEKFTNLKYIQLTSAGLDRLPMDYIKQNHIKVYNAKDVYSIPIAEFVIMSILQIYKDSKSFYKKQSMHIWEKNRKLKELKNKHIAILGVGSIGREIAKRLYLFDCHIIGYDIEKKEERYFEKIKLIDNLDNDLHKFDIIICCLPLTKQTKNFFNYTRLKRLKEESVIINTSRGGIINEEALYKLLKSRKTMSAVLDVFETEPLDRECELWELDNILITPHNFFVGEYNNSRLYNVILTNLNKIKEGM